MRLKVGEVAGLESFYFPKIRRDKDSENFESARSGHEHDDSLT
jgi:hypothetical protein